MTTPTITPRYALEPPVADGSWYATYGWGVRDTQQTDPAFKVFARGTKIEMRRWVRELNAR